MPHFPIALPALLLALALTGTAQAQPAAPAPTDTARTYKHHLGLTASPVLSQFFTANRSLPVGLLYKRQTAPNKLWRFGLVVNQNYSRRDEYNPDLPYIVKNNNEEFINNAFGISASLGREFTHQFSPRWTGAAGADVGVGFSRFQRTTKSQLVGTGSLNPLILEDELVTRNHYYQAALTPFVGLRYNMWPSLYVSAESAISAAYLRDVFEFYDKRSILNTGEVLFGTDGFDGQKQTDQSLTLRFRFINQLTLHYMLGKR